MPEPMGLCRTLDGAGSGLGGVLTVMLRAYRSRERSDDAGGMLDVRRPGVKRRRLPSRFEATKSVLWRL
jgi:hypothetical protein